MSSKSSSLLRVPIDVPNRTGHNCDHSNAFSGTTGTLIPVLCDELLPRDTVSLGDVLQCQLPPMVTDFYGRVDFVLEAFFVPNRLCWGGWKDFITHDTATPVYPDGTQVQAKPKRVPYFYVASGQNQNVSVNIDIDTCLHYLDYGSTINSAVNGEVSVLKAVAYHRIWDDWYRDSRVQAPLFYKPPWRWTDLSQQKLTALPFVSTENDSDSVIINYSATFSDGVPLISLRQRNWVKDYFTSASPLPQAGGAAEVKFDVSSVNETGVFSIATLRAANSLQMWKERNNLAGYRYSDQIHAQFGIYPSDAIMDRCLYLGRHVNTVYNKSVYSTNGAESDGTTSLGTKGANSQVLGEGSLINSFTASEHGFLIVLASLVPRPVYGSGAERSSFRVVTGDFAFPLLAGMGDQAILGRELTGNMNSKETFGYTDLYAEYKFKNDKTHGLLRDGQNLESFALQRSFVGDNTPTISSAFLQIPRDYLDQVQVVSTSVSGYSYWAEIYFPYKKISTIPAYSQPTLANIEHAHKEFISRGGKRL